MYHVDTNVVSEARRGSREAVAWLRSVEPGSLHLSALTLGEITRGVALKRKSDPQTAARLEEWLKRLRRDHADRVLPVTDEVAVEWGRIDALIAATAIVHDLILVTRNVGDFDDIGVSLINPWSAAR